MKKSENVSIRVVGIFSEDRGFQRVKEEEEYSCNVIRQWLGFLLLNYSLLVNRDGTGKVLQTKPLPKKLTTVNDCIFACGRVKILAIQLNEVIDLQK